MYKFWGKVRIGQKRGKKLGFPTANLNLRKNIPEGIYISKLKLEGKQYPSITFIGKVKTFNETKYQAEIFILDFNRNIYNFWVTVTLIKKIRGNQKFKNEKELTKQIKKDEKVARKHFSSFLFSFCTHKTI